MMLLAPCSAKRSPRRHGRSLLNARPTQNTSLTFSRGSRRAGDCARCGRWPQPPTPNLNGKPPTMVGRLARGEVPALHLTDDAPLDARIAERAAAERCARHVAARIDRPLHGHAALERRVALRLALVASAHGAEVSHDDATNLLLREAALRRAALRHRRRPSTRRARLRPRRCRFPSPCRRRFRPCRCRRSRGRQDRPRRCRSRRRCPRRSRCRACPSRTRRPRRCRRRRSPRPSGRCRAPLPRTTVFELSPESAADTVLIDLSVFWISLPVSPSRTSLRPP